MTTSRSRSAGLLLWASLAVAVAAFGCSTPPKVYQFEATRSYAKGFDFVWQDLMKFFTSANVQIKTVEKDSGVVYAEALNFDISQASCGSHSLFVPLSRTLALNVFVAPVEATQGTSVTVNARFSERRQYTLDRSVVQDFVCHSTGEVEALILNAIR